uniref:MSP domain-containing protein n=1 Tax=Parascaris univalens TaxID=6257 RepID=A0A915A2B2_PARUN
MILVEYDFQWCTVIFASFRFLVTPLPRLCGAGMEATKYFEKNKSAILANAKIGHISCLETAQSDAALQRITSIPSLRPLSTVSTSEVESVLKYGKFVVLRAPTSKRKESPPNQANSPEYERSPPNALRTLVFIFGSVRSLFVLKYTRHRCTIIDCSSFRQAHQHFSCIETVTDITERIITKTSLDNKFIF